MSAPGRRGGGMSAQVAEAAALVTAQVAEAAV